LKPGAIFIFDDYFWRMHNPANMRPKLAVDIFVESFLEGLEVLGSFNKQLFLRKTKGRTKLRATGDQVVEWLIKPVRSRGRHLRLTCRASCFCPFRGAC
jgi:hypothetical protein